MHEDAPTVIVNHRSAYITKPGKFAGYSKTVWISNTVMIEKIIIKLWLDLPYGKVSQWTAWTEHRYLTTRDHMKNMTGCLILVCCYKPLVPTTRVDLTGRGSELV